MSTDLQGLPAQIGRYELRSVLGRGGMGRVVLAHDPVLRRDVALKLVEPSNVAVEDLAELRFMFHREARATASLRHPNILEVFDYSGPDADLMYLACELIDGPTLRDVLDERGPLAPEVVAAIGYELAQALDHAHGHGIVHRDLKPENVFWTDAGRVVLADFGIAKAFDGSDRLGGTIQFGGTNLYGSPTYMAPEQLQGTPVGPHTDLYALGALLYESLSGRPAVEGTEVEAILDAVAAGKHAPLEVPRAPHSLVRLIESLLDADPARRPSHAHEVARRLRQILDGLGVSDPRLVLTSSGERTVAIATGEDGTRTVIATDTGEGLSGDDEDDATEIFAQPESDSIRVQGKPGRWASLATRGPFIIGMLALAIGMGLGAYLILHLSDLPKNSDSYLPQAASGPSVSTDASKLPTVDDTQDIFVLLRFHGHNTVLIDGREVGTWDDHVRLALPPGKHDLEVRGAAGTVRRSVLLITGTTPVFELYPPVEPAKK